MSGKKGFAYHLYLLSNFPRAAILDYRRHKVAQLFHTKDALLPNNSGNHMVSENPKWRCTGNLKAKIGDNLNSIFITLDMNAIFTLSSKI